MIFLKNLPPQKSTDDLLEILKQQSLDTAMNEIEPDQPNITIKNYIDKFLAEHNAQPSDIHKKSGITRSYFYALTEGAKTNPSRDIMIRLCFGLGLDLDETQRFLKTFGAAMLYARNRRDSIIIHAIDNGLSVRQCDDNLFEYGEKPLVGGG